MQQLSQQQQLLQAHELLLQQLQQACADDAGDVVQDAAVQAEALAGAADSCSSNSSSAEAMVPRLAGEVQVLLAGNARAEALQAELQAAQERNAALQHELQGLTAALAQLRASTASATSAQQQQQQQSLSRRGLPAASVAAPPSAVPCLVAEDKARCLQACACVRASQMHHTWLADARLRTCLLSQALLQQLAVKDRVIAQLSQQLSQASAEVAAGMQLRQQLDAVHVSV